MGVRGSFLEEVTSEKRARLTRGSRVGRRMEKVQPAGAACAKALGWREQSPSEKGRTGEAGAQSERGRGCWGAAGPRSWGLRGRIKGPSFSIHGVRPLSLP